MSGNNVYNFASKRAKSVRNQRAEMIFSLYFASAFLRECGGIRFDLCNYTIPQVLFLSSKGLFPCVLFLLFHLYASIVPDLGSAGLLHGVCWATPSIGELELLFKCIRSFFTGCFLLVRIDCMSQWCLVTFLFFASCSNLQTWLGVSR